MRRQYPEKIHLCCPEAEQPAKREKAGPDRLLFLALFFSLGLHASILILASLFPPAGGAAFPGKEAGERAGFLYLSLVEGGSANIPETASLPRPAAAPVLLPRESAAPLPPASGQPAPRRFRPESREAPGALPGASSERGGEAREGSSGESGGPASPAAGGPGGYLGRNFSYIQSHIGRNLIYPARARRSGLTGRATYSFTITPEGKVEDLVLRTSSGQRILDEAGRAAILRSAPFPPPPEPARITIPIVFRLT
ncbi:MAG: TonB family protein [Deltaproteobacteria bacterium]|nr:TonB family protein [Deltaproteobacteria bacterium]